MTRVFESNGPDIKIRGTASHVAEKYVQLARDARSSGDPVAAENYYQHAEHYFRLIAAAQEQFRQNQPQQQPRPENEMPSAEDGDDESENFSNFGQEPGFVPSQQQPPLTRDNNQRDHQREGQPYQRDQHQPREHNNNRDHRPQPQYQPQPQSQPQPVISDASVDRLPSFITGPQPQINGGQTNNNGGFEGNGGDRFPPRRRRRPQGPRPEGMAPVTPGDDFNPGNE
jgi:type II secretory pathway pseudopilin PulG